MNAIAAHLLGLKPINPATVVRGRIHSTREDNPGKSGRIPSEETMSNAKYAIGTINAPYLTVKNVMEASGYSQWTTRQILTALEEDGFIKRASDLRAKQALFVVS